MEDASPSVFPAAYLCGLIFFKFPAKDSRKLLAARRFFFEPVYVQVRLSSTAIISSMVTILPGVFVQWYAHSNYKQKHVVSARLRHHCFTLVEARAQPATTILRLQFLHHQRSLSVLQSLDPTGQQAVPQTHPKSGSKQRGYRQYPWIHESPN